MSLRRRCVFFILLSPLVGVATAAETAGAASDAPDFSLTALIVPLLAVVFALAALLWIVRRRGMAGSGAGPARIVQVLGVGPRERVLVVDCDSRRFLLGITASTITLLSEIDTENAASETSRATPLRMTNKPST